jgi:hypothetical protein
MLRKALDAWIRGLRLGEVSTEWVPVAQLPPFHTPSSVGQRMVAGASAAELD